jgi:hypothetical protein
VEAAARKMEAVNETDHEEDKEEMRLKWANGDEMMEI